MHFSFDYLNMEAKLYFCFQNACFEQKVQKDLFTMQNLDQKWRCNSLVLGRWKSNGNEGCAIFGFLTITAKRSKGKEAGGQRIYTLMPCEKNGLFCLILQSMKLRNNVLILIAWKLTHNIYKINTKINLDLLRMRIQL